MLAEIKAPHPDMLSCNFKGASVHAGLHPQFLSSLLSSALLPHSLLFCPLTSQLPILIPRLSPDCPWNPNFDRANNKICAGPLLLSPGAAPPQSCSAYFPKLIPGAVPAAVQVRVCSVLQALLRSDRP